MSAHVSVSVSVNVSANDTARYIVNIPATNFGAIRALLERGINVSGADNASHLQDLVSRLGECFLKESQDHIAAVVRNIQLIDRHEREAGRADDHADITRANEDLLEAARAGDIPSKHLAALERLVGAYAIERKERLDAVAKNRQCEIGQCEAVQETLARSASAASAAAVNLGAAARMAKIKRASQLAHQIDDFDEGAPVLNSRGRLP